MAAPALFRLCPIESPWGDYGHILAHGMSMHQPRRDGILLLERTGPAIAPITFPQAVVVTQDFRVKIEGSGLTGFTFLPVIKHHIVELDWESWDTTEEEPPEYPDSGEPEDFILTRPHSPAAARALGELWEMVFHENGIDVERRGTDVRFLPETWDGTDFFHSRTTTTPCVSLKARQWLEQHFGDYVEFKPLDRINPLKR